MTAGPNAPLFPVLSGWCFALAGVSQALRSDRVTVLAAAVNEWL
ncbi:hypothetical protein [Streptomyces carpinensis]|uniref:Uncharacterized protein n=1 Tax=Streptomyces carpinensis TaxID=66369 RepID=A0ABV1W9U5_9ACTN|nr:hypothetical protein [Streptomyces carpinensis]